MDLTIYAGHLVIWVVIWAAYYLVLQATGKGGFVVWVTFLVISAAASLAYYAATNLVLTAYYSVKSIVGGWW